jgi:hypothetical protein
MNVLGTHIYGLATYTYNGLVRMTITKQVLLSTTLGYQHNILIIQLQLIHLARRLKSDLRLIALLTMTKSIPQCMIQMLRLHNVWIINKVAIPQI